MFRTTQFFFACVILVSGCVSLASAQFSDNFDSASTASNYTVLAPNAGTVTFGYDYSTDSIPVAPNTTGTSTLGLRMTANDAAIAPATGGAADSGMVVRNTDVTLSAYDLSVDVYMGVTGTGGSTEFGGAGVAGDGTTKNTIFAPTDGSGHFISFTGEGGSSSDFRHFTPTGITNSGDPSYLNSTNTTNATGDTYQTIFSAANGYGDYPGSPGNNWATLQVKVRAANVTYMFNGTPIIKTPFDGTDGDKVSLSYSDLFASIATPFQSQFVIFDNLSVVQAVPEPSSAGLLLAACLSGLGLLRRRR